MGRLLRVAHVKFYVVYGLNREGVFLLGTGLFGGDSYIRSAIGVIITRSVGGLFGVHGDCLLALNRRDAAPAICHTEWF